MSGRHAPDTNLVVRLLVDDDPAQTRVARRFFSDQPLYFPVTVLLESEWVLRAVYGHERERIVMALRMMIRLANAATEDEDQVLSALAHYEQGFDFADALHLSRLPADTTFASFDRSLVKHAQKAGLKAGLPAEAAQ